MEIESSKSENVVTSNVIGNLTAVEILETIEHLVEKPYDSETRAKVDGLKQLFYKTIKMETSAENKEEEYSVKKYKEEELRLKELMAIYNEKKAAEMARIVAEQTENLKKKQTIIDQIRSFASDTDSVSLHTAEMKNLQSQWKEIGKVPAMEATDLNKNYVLALEAFYDLLKINHELRVYDFKKNLEAKKALCETAEQLSEEKDVILAFRTLQGLHEQWAEVGPVEKELREEIWTRFKNASTVINKRHNDYFESKKREEEENLCRKQALCDKVRELSKKECATAQAWKEATEEILKAQQEWKTIGFATKKENENVYNLFRKYCNAFFEAKNNFFSEIRSQFSDNEAHKRDLIVAVERLKTSTDWKETTEKIVELQRQWKTIGATMHKVEEDLWKQFSDACHYFFNQKEAAQKQVRSEEKENLARKISIVEKLESFALTENAGEDVKAIKAMIAEYNEIGHVPFNKKEQLYQRFRAICDKHFEALHVNNINRKLEDFEENVSALAMNKPQLKKEMDKIRRKIEELTDDIKNSEKNIMLFSSGKKENPLAAEMQRNIAKMKREKEVWQKKLAMLESAK